MPYDLGQGPPPVPTVDDLARLINAQPPNLNAIVQMGINAPELFEQLGPKTKARLQTLMQLPVPRLPGQAGPAGSPVQGQASLMLEQYLAQTPAGPYLQGAKMFLPGTFRDFEKKLDSLTDRYFGWADKWVTQGADYLTDFFTKNPVGIAILSYFFPIAGVGALINLFDEDSDKEVKAGLARTVLMYSVAVSPLGLTVPNDNTWRVDGEDYGEPDKLSFDLSPRRNFPLDLLPRIPPTKKGWTWGDKGATVTKKAWLIKGTWYRVWPIIGKIEGRGPTRTGNF